MGWTPSYHHPLPQPLYGPLWTCPYCRWSGSPQLLARVSKISVQGWIVFVVLLFVCFLLSPLPLITMKTTATKCPCCGTPMGVA